MIEKSEDWKEYALCHGAELNDYFDDYEEDKQAARKVDQTCLNCPVIAECLEYGVAYESHGVYGGLFLEYGQLSDQHNAHKTTEDWKELKHVLRPAFRRSLA